MERSKMECLIVELQRNYSASHGGLGVITRSELARRSGGLFKRKTLANWDSKGKGLGECIHDTKTGQTAYYIEDVISYMRTWLAGASDRRRQKGGQQRGGRFGAKRA